MRFKQGYYIHKKTKQLAIYTDKMEIYWKPFSDSLLKGLYEDCDYDWDVMLCPQKNDFTFIGKL